MITVVKLLVILCIGIISRVVAEKPCSNLLPGQFLCELPEIDSATQQPAGCTKDNLAPVSCNLTSGATCLTSNNGTFESFVKCQYTNGKSYRTALLLSIFLGWLGIDRFYLGYITIGLFKLTTFGFMLLFYLLDIILIALQIVQPADGSSYLIDYYGPHAIPVNFDNDTFINQPIYN